LGVEDGDLVRRVDDGQTSVYPGSVLPLIGEAEVIGANESAGTGAGRVAGEQALGGPTASVDGAAHQVKRPTVCVGLANHIGVVADVLHTLLALEVVAVGVDSALQKTSILDALLRELAL